MAAWSSNSADGGDLSVSTAAHLAGSMGERAVIDDANAIYVRDDRPNAERRYRARFYVDPNTIRMANNDSFDLVWCAGLFDYLDDTAAVLLLRRLGKSLSASGTMVIGNFGPNVRSRSYMEFGEWRLNYRSGDDLLALAKAAGFQDRRLSVEQEATGVNLFLRIDSEPDSTA